MIDSSLHGALLYVRETDGQDIAAQIEQCRRYAEARGFVPVATVIDLVTPGRAYRLGWRGVMDMVVAGKLPLVVAAAADHVSKDPTRLEAVREMLTERNCELHFAADPTTASPPSEPT